MAQIKDSETQKQMTQTYKNGLRINVPCVNDDHHEKPFYTDDRQYSTYENHTKLHRIRLFIYLFLNTTILSACNFYFSPFFWLIIVTNVSLALYEMCACDRKREIDVESR